MRLWKARWVQGKKRFPRREEWAYYQPETTGKELADANTLYLV